MKYPLKFKRNGHKAERIFVHSKSRGGQESGNENVGINLLWLNFLSILHHMDHVSRAMFTSINEG